MKAQKTVPLDPEDWLHGFQAGLDGHAWPKERFDDQGHDRDPDPQRSRISLGLAPECGSDNVFGSFAI